MGEFDRQPEPPYQGTLEVLARRRRVLADLGTVNRRMELRLKQLNRESDQLLEDRRQAMADDDAALCERIDRELTLTRQEIKGLEAEHAVGTQAMAEATREIVRMQADIDTEGWG